MSKKDFVPADWIAAGYRRFEKNAIMRPSESFMLQKRVVEEDTGRTRYFISVGVYDYSDLPQVPYQWGFQPEVQFTREVTMNVTLHTSDPAVAESEFEALWIALGKPYYE